MLPGHQTCPVQGEGVLGAGTHWGDLLPSAPSGTLGSPNLTASVSLLDSRLAAWEWGNGQSQRGVSRDMGKDRHEPERWM